MEAHICRQFEKKKEDKKSVGHHNEIESQKQ